MFVAGSNLGSVKGGGTMTHSVDIAPLLRYTSRRVEIRYSLQKKRRKKCLHGRISLQIIQKTNSRKMKLLLLLTKQGQIKTK